MFSWGENCQQGFRLKDGANISTVDGVHLLPLGFDVTHLSAGHGGLAFIRSNGDAAIIRTNESKDGGRVRGKQKFVKCKEKIQAVACGDDDAVTLLSRGGKVLCVDTTCTYIPKPLEAFSNITVSQVACGSRHSVALTEGGQVYTWGQDSRGQLGLGRNKHGSDSPQHLRYLSALPLVQVAAGGEQSFALSVSGGVFGWGGNDRGQLGLGDIRDRTTPTPVRCLNTKKTIYISCGKDHTAILTKNGAVLTFGSGQYGQLGHNSFTDELRPRLVVELWGAKVTKIACGRNHTLALTDSNRVYSFGCGEQGQLGHGEESHPSVPLPVQLPLDTAVAGIRNIFAGGNCSFATCASTKDVRKANTGGVNDRALHRLDDLIDKCTTECDLKSWKKIKKTFSSASSLNASFLEKSKDKHFQTSPKYSGLNLSVARLAFEKLVKRDDVFAEVEAAVLHLLPSLDKKTLGVEGLRIYLLLNELLHVIQRHEHRRLNTTLAEAVAAAVVNLSADSLRVIGDWWSSLPPSTTVEHVEVWKRAVSVVLSSQPVPRDSGVRNLMQVLQYMYNANSRTAEPQRMPETNFCWRIDKNFLNEDLQFWRLRSQRKHMNAEPLILCSFPILMDLESKKFVFDQNATYTMEARVRKFWELLLQCIFPEPQNLVYDLDLSRASLLDDTFQRLDDHEDYKLPLVVYFDENFTNHDDYNLYRKDFFHEVFHEMMSPETGMFMFNDSKTLAWFPSTDTEDEQRYFQFGVLCGLALYNQHIIHLPFPLALFKKLLGVKPSLEDMIEFSPCVGQSLLNILENYEDDAINKLDMDFVINWDGTDIDLDPKSPEKPLTGENKKEFVDAYVNHVFNTAVKDVFQEFKQGFFQVCEQDLVKLFRPKELQKVLVGEDFHDWAKLKQNTVYEGVYSTTPLHPTIQMFWEVFDELTEDQKKAFLWFVTGFERVPILGMEKIKLKVKIKGVPDLSYDRYYPETHTCFSQLELPLYSTKEIMKTKLTEALSNHRRSYK